MGRHPTRPRKFDREIEHHRRLYEHRELSRVTDNWIFYWRFLAHLQDRDYRPRTVERYHQMLRSFLVWTDVAFLYRTCTARLSSLAESLGIEGKDDRSKVANLLGGNAKSGNRG